jgi:hypothetical protein
MKLIHEKRIVGFFEAKITNIQKFMRSHLLLNQIKPALTFVKVISLC